MEFIDTWVILQNIQLTKSIFLHVVQDELWLPCFDLLTGDVKADPTMLKRIWYVLPWKWKTAGEKGDDQWLVGYITEVSFAFIFSDDWCYETAPHKVIFSNTLTSFSASKATASVFCMCCYTAFRNVLTCQRVMAYFLKHSHIRDDSRTFEIQVVSLTISTCFLSVLLLL